MNGYSNQLNKYEEIRKIKIERKKSVNWIKIVVLILQIQNINTTILYKILRNKCITYVIL